MLSKQQLTFALSLKGQEELIQQLMKEAQQGMKNQADRGGCYPRWITPSEVCLIFHTLRKPNSLINLLFIQNNSQFKNIAKTCLPPSILSSSSIVYVQVCPAPQIFSTSHMSPSELCSCHVFSYYFAQFQLQFLLLKRVKCLPFFVFTTKTTEPRTQVLSVTVP